MLWTNIWIIHHTNENEKSLQNGNIKWKLFLIMQKIKDQVKKALRLDADKEYRKILREKLAKAIDKFIYVIALFWPIMTVPQIIKIWETKDVAWLSIRTWSAYITNSSFWLIYGLLHKEKPIIISQIFRLLVNGSIFIWILLYW